MSEYSIQSGTLSDIANSIRAKTGKNNAMTPLEMPSEIASIPGGGGNIDITFKNYAKFNNSGIYLPEFKLNSDYKITVTFHQTQYKNNENIIGTSKSYIYLQLTSYGSTWYTSTGGSEQASSIAWTAGEHEFINNDNGYNKFDGNNMSKYTPTTINDAMICIGYRPAADTCNSYIKKFLIEKISTGKKVLELKPAIIAGSMTYTYDVISDVSCLFDTVNEKAYFTNGTMSCVDSIPS